MAEGEQSNYEILRDCVSSPIIKHHALPEPKQRKRKVHKSKSGSKSNHRSDAEAIKEDGEEDGMGAAAEDLAEFIDYLTAEIFASLPAVLRSLDYTTYESDASLRETYAVPLSSETVSVLLVPFAPTIADSLLSYQLVPSSDHVPTFLTAVLSEYITAITAAPPVWSATRTSACELCGRDWVPLTYHHLIPRSTHAKVKKRGWHPDWRLNAVAWLCRACHTFVHGLASNEELAREWWSLDLLQGRQDVQDWAKWIGKVRWKKR